MGPREGGGVGPEGRRKGLVGGVGGGWGVACRLITAGLSAYGYSTVLYIRLPHCRVRKGT